MDIATLKHLLLWCTLINYAILLVWFFTFVFARGFMLDIHGRWFELSNEEFDSIHYRSMAQYKIGVILFNLTPYLALTIAA